MAENYQNSTKNRAETMNENRKYLYQASFEVKNVVETQFQTRYNILDCSSKKLCTKKRRLMHKGLKAHCHPGISYDHTKFISEVHSKNVGTNERAKTKCYTRG